jgi:hypothetical protein
MKIDSRLGTIGFSRHNSTIQPYELADDVQTMNITAAPILAAFHRFFTGKGPEEDKNVPSECSDLIDFLLGKMDPSTLKLKMGHIFIGLYFGMGPCDIRQRQHSCSQCHWSLLLVAKIL